MTNGNDISIHTDPVSEMVCSQCSARLNVAAFSFLSKVACPKCASEQTVPGRLGHFLLTSILGRGGMGATFIGHDVLLNRSVAIKVMLRRYGEDLEFIKSFKREAQATAALNHPNIVQIYSFGIEMDQPYIVMELLTGGRMEAMIAEKKPVDQTLILKIGMDVAEGLNAANNIDLIHGDIKPENILLDANGTAKVVDFGLAYFRSRGMQPDGVWGTPYYIAPEKVRRLPSDARADIYSLGATLFHVLAGQPPFEGQTPVDVVKARLNGPAPLLSLFRKDINPRIEAIIQRMLEMEPARRYPNYNSLISDMRNVLDALNPPVPGIKPKRPGKIIFTKMKKGAGTLSPMPDSNAGGTPPETGGSAAGQKNNKARLDPVARRRRLRKWLIIGGSAAAAILIIGGGMAAYRHYKQVKADKAEQAHIAATLAELRQKADTLFTDFQAVLTNNTKRLDGCEQSQKTASISRELISTMASSLKDTEPGAAAPATVSNLWSALESQMDIVRSNQSAILSISNSISIKRLVLSGSNTLENARRVQSEIQALADKAKGLDKTNITAIVQIIASERHLADLKDSLQKLRDEKEKENQRIAVEKAAAEQKAREEAEARNREEALQQQIKKEKDILDSLVKSNLASVRKNQFAEALTALKNGTAEFGTEKGKAAAASAITRVELMIELKTFLVGAINQEAGSGGYRYGWLVHGIPTLDIMGATETQVRVRGFNAPWNEVSILQMIAFIKHYLPNADLFKTRKERARMNLAAAAYYYEGSGGAKNGLQMAADCAGEATNLDSGLRTLAEQLFPDLPR